MILREVTFPAGGPDSGGGAGGGVMLVGVFEPGVRSSSREIQCSRVLDFILFFSGDTWFFFY